jgi:hypothetical protein
MARRVGSPKAFVMADTAAVNAPGVSVEVGAVCSTPVFYLSP